ncbi:hypothetical protein KJ591_01320, partial [Patescibacteria group bacterium]|nr:hypothetical protein [Patescibacteria group bacterium]
EQNISRDVKKDTKNDNRKMLLGIVVIIGIMALSYVLFPANREIGDRGFDFGKEIQKLQEDISNIDFLPLPATTTDTIPATSTDFFDFEINGPGGCSTFEQCEEYCSIIENLEECGEFFGEF